MKTPILFQSLLFSVSLMSASVLADQPTLNLWPNGNPDCWTLSEPETGEERGGILRIRNVSEPLIEIYQPEKDKANGLSMIIAPGGGYSILAWNHEGEEIAEWLNGFGVTAFVLKYRLPKKGDPSRHHVALQDSQRAVRLVRAHAEEWGIRPDKIGIMGFSAGGHLSAITATKFNEPNYDPVDEADQLSCRPDFVGLIYPAYLFDKESQKLNADFNVTSENPPTFFTHTGDDPVTVESSLIFYQALRNAGVAAELHVFPKGGHGYGMRTEVPGIASWPDLYKAWILRQLNE